MTFIIAKNGYLRKRGITKPWTIKPIPKKKFPIIVIIPSYNESILLPETLSSIAKNDKGMLKDVLVIIIVNHAVNTIKKIKLDNKKTLDKLHNIKYPFAVGIIDAASPGMELTIQHAGVGMARKIGMDIALNYVVDNKSLLCCTDADTTVNKNYFITLKDYFNKTKIDAAVVRFQHKVTKQSNINRAIKEYENFLIETSNKLRFAGSPYNYVAMGSTMVCTAKAYIAVGGMPKKKPQKIFIFYKH